MKLDRLGFSAAVCALLDLSKAGSFELLTPLSDVVHGAFCAAFDDPAVATTEFDRFAHRVRDRIEAELATRVVTHRCPSCGREKPALDFYLRRRGGNPVARMLVCKACHIERIRQGREARKSRSRGMVHEHV